MHAADVVAPSAPRGKAARRGRGQQQTPEGVSMRHEESYDDQAL
jgi:hypothetical protein